MERGGEFLADGTLCRIRPIGRPAPGNPLICWGQGGGSGEDFEQVCGLLQILGLPPFLLAAFEREDWNAAFSPWPAPGLPGRGEFAGEAADTLRFLERRMLPELARWKPGPCFLAGYSLAGLFALWALCETQCFAGAAGCSPSLWYDGFEEFFAPELLPENSRVYLSLGRSEERTRDPRMARVGNAVRHTAARLENAGRGVESVLCWHDGGHFHEPGKRIAQGIAWLAAGPQGSRDLGRLNAKRQK